MTKYEWANYVYGDKLIDTLAQPEVKINIRLKKPNNNAPKSVKGDYTLSIHGNKIVLVDSKDGATVEAKCHPDDEFDIKAGIEEAFKKLNEKREELRKQKEEEEKRIKVGDWVEVVNWGMTYDTYPDWLYTRVDFENVKVYDYNNCCKNGTKGKVIAVGNHDDEHRKDRTLVAFRTKNNKVYIVEDQGLRKVAKPSV